MSFDLRCISSLASQNPSSFSHASWNLHPVDWFWPEVSQSNLCTRVPSLGVLIATPVQFSNRLRSDCDSLHITQSDWTELLKYPRGIWTRQDQRRVCEVQQNRKVRQKIMNWLNLILQFLINLSFLFGHWKKHKNCWYKIFFLITHEWNEFINFNVD